MAQIPPTFDVPLFAAKKIDVPKRHTDTPSPHTLDHTAFVDLAEFRVGSLWLRPRVGLPVFTEHKAAAGEGKG